jgi:hypothetical protein
MISDSVRGLPRGRSGSSDWTTPARLGTSDSGATDARTVTLDAGHGLCQKGMSIWGKLSLRGPPLRTSRATPTTRSVIAGPGVDSPGSTVLMLSRCARGSRPAR